MLKANDFKKFQKAAPVSERAKVLHCARQKAGNSTSCWLAELATQTLLRQARTALSIEDEHVSFAKELNYETKF